MHQIWLIIDENNKIKHCWEAPEPIRAELENQPPLILDPMPLGWKIIKAKEPILLKQFHDEAQNKGKTLSQFILDECEIDDKANPLRSSNLPSNIDFKEIRIKK